MYATPTLSAALNSSESLVPRYCKRSKIVSGVSRKSAMSTNLRA